MKYLYVLVFLICMNVHPASAQTTMDLFTLPGLTFVIDIYDDTGQFSDGFLYYIGDTVHQDTTYLVYEQKSNYPIYLHVDGYKVFSTSLENDYERLLFDFGMEVGDTLLHYFDEVYVLDSKGTIQLSDGLDRIEMNFVNPTFTNRELRIIEGVGYAKHGLFTYMYSQTILQCLTTNNHDLFLNEDFSLEDCDSRSCPGIKASFNLEGDRESINLINNSIHYDSLSLTFGDGIYYNEFIDSHTYSETGCYKIELEVFNECGDNSFYTDFYNFCEDPKWTKLSDIDLRKIHFLDDDKGFAVTWEKAYKTTDSGSNWTSISFPAPHQNYRPNSIYFADSQYGIVTSAHNEDEFSIMVTTDGGSSWVGVFNENYSFVKAIIDKEGTIFAVNYHGSVFRSYNMGTTWEQLDIPYSWIHSDFQILDNNVLILANRKHLTYDFISLLFISNDNGDTWHEIDMTFNNGISSVHFFDESHGLAGMRSNLYETFDRGQTWQTVFSLKEIGLIQNLHFSDSNKGIMTINNRYYVTSDGGQNWEVEYCHNTNTIYDLQIVENEIYSANRNGFHKRMADAEFDCNDLNGLDQEPTLQLDIVPTLTTGLFQILSDQDGSYTIEIRNIDGNLVKTEKVSNHNFIDVLSFPSGLYFVSVRSHKVNKTFKIIKI